MGNNIAIIMYQYESISVNMSSYEYRQVPMVLKRATFIILMVYDGTKMFLCLRETWLLLLSTVSPGK